MVTSRSQETLVPAPAPPLAACVTLGSEVVFLTSLNLSFLLCQVEIEIPA